MVQDFSVDRYERMAYRRCGRSGLMLPAISLGAWETYGGYMLSRGIERDLLPHTERAGTGVIAFCPLASGLLTEKYLHGDLPADSRAAQRWSEQRLRDNLTPEKRERLLALNEIARARGQSLAQMALAWILRLPAVTSALIGASRVEQIDENVRALENLAFSDEELAKIEAALSRG